MPTPLVSVIIPTFNRAYCVCQAVDTTLQQRDVRLEVIIIDDGSQDDTRQVIRSRYAGDSRVQYLHQENTGAAGARNTGLQAAQGEFLALLDSDDLWLPWKLKVQLGVLAAWPDVGMVWTDMDAIDSQGRVLQKNYLRTFYTSYKWWTPDTLFDRHASLRQLAPALADEIGDATVHAGDIYSQMITGNLVHTSTVLLRRERFERVGLFDASIRPNGEDYEFHLRTTREGPVAFLDASSMLYQRGFNDRLTRPEFERHVARNFLRVIEPRLRVDRDRIVLPQKLIRTVLADAYDWLGSAELAVGQRAAARRHLAASLRQDWRRPRTAALCLLSCLPRSADDALRNVWRFILGSDSESRSADRAQHTTRNRETAGVS